MVTCLEYLNYQLQKIVANYNDSMYEAYMSKAEEILKMILAYSLFTNLGIILAYLTTYVILNRHIRKCCIVNCRESSPQS